jgi:hypothetical protein
MDKVQQLVHVEKSLNYSIYDVKWIPYSAKFVCVGTKTNGKGIVEIYELDSPNIQLAREIPVDNAIKCCSFGTSSPGEKHLVIGDFNGKLKIL